MLSLGQTIVLWRLKRGLNQNDLARRAGLSRPHLSSLERGQREANLRTLRALASALETTPGTLIDGVPPNNEASTMAFSRSVLERIAEAVVHQTPLQFPIEQRLASCLRESMRFRLRQHGKWEGNLRRGKKASNAAWLELKAVLPADVLESLIERVGKRMTVYE